MSLSGRGLRMVCASSLFPFHPLPRDCNIPDRSYSTSLDWNKSTGGSYPHRTCIMSNNQIFAVKGHGTVLLQCSLPDLDWTTGCNPLKWFQDPLTDCSQRSGKLLYLLPLPLLPNTSHSPNITWLTTFYSTLSSHFILLFITSYRTNILRSPSAAPWCPEKPLVWTFSPLHSISLGSLPHTHYAASTSDHSLLSPWASDIKLFSFFRTVSTAYNV